MIIFLIALFVLMGALLNIFLWYCYTVTFNRRMVPVYKGLKFWQKLAIIIPYSFFFVVMVTTIFKKGIRIN